MAFDDLHRRLPIYRYAVAFEEGGTFALFEQGKYDVIRRRRWYRTRRQKPLLSVSAAAHVKKVKDEPEAEVGAAGGGEAGGAPPGAAPGAIHSGKSTPASSGPPSRANSRPPSRAASRASSSPAPTSRPASRAAERAGSPATVAQVAAASASSAAGAGIGAAVPACAGQPVASTELTIKEGQLDYVKAAEAQAATPPGTPPGGAPTPGAPAAAPEPREAPHLLASGLVWRDVGKVKSAPVAESPDERTS